MAQSIQWIEVARRGKAHALLFIDSVTELYRQGYFAKAHGISWNPRHYRQFNNGRSFSVEDGTKYLGILENYVHKTPERLFRAGKDYEQRIMALRAFTDQNKKINFSKAPNRLLLQTFQKWFELTLRLWVYGYHYIFLNKFLPDEITAAVALRERNILKQNEYLGVLFVADRPFELWEEKVSLVKITQLAREGKLKKDSPKFARLISTHLRKFGHLGYYYFRGAPYTKAQILERLKEYLDFDREKFFGILEDIKTQKQNAARTKEIIKRLQLDSETVHKIRIVKRWAYLSNYVDESYNYGVCHLRPLFEELAKHLGLSFDELVHLRAAEIASGLKTGKLALTLRREAKERVKAHAIILDGKKVYALSGKRLQVYASKEQKDEEEFKSGIRELKGQAASPGRVRGKVRIVYTTHDLPKVERGDILVTYATNPMYVPAMEKAKAIVTDEGGLLSHAAIVSRELKVPCVVGTKIATKAFKDGDLVEVDATRGIVKKINP